MTQEFGLKNIHETRNCFLEEIKQNELMSKRNRFFDCYFYSDYEFCNRIKNFCNNCTD